VVRRRRRAKRAAVSHRPIIIAVLLVMVAGVTTAVVGRLLPSERVYSVAELSSDVHQNPRQWVGRTVLVRGQVVGVGQIQGMSMWETWSCRGQAFPCYEPGPVDHLLVMDALEASHYNVTTIDVGRRHAGLVLQAPTLPASATDALVTFLRSLPGIGRLIPVPPPLQARVLTYRVRVLSPLSTCATPRSPQICDDAVVLGTQ